MARENGTKKNAPASSETDALLGNTTAAAAEQTLDDAIAAGPSVEELMAEDPAVIQAKILQMNYATARLQFEAAKRAMATAPSQEVAQDAELKRVQLQTAQLDLLLAQERNQNIIETRAERIARRKQALADMEAEADMWANIQSGCAHRVGGFDLADTYNGDGKTSIVCSTLPIIGMELLYCTRCRREAITPDQNKLNPDHEHYNPEQYAKDEKNYREMRELYRNSYNAKPMGGPQFAFHDKKTRVPVHPTIR